MEVPFEPKWPSPTTQSTEASSFAATPSLYVIMTSADILRIAMELFTWPARSAVGDEITLSTLQGMHSQRNTTSIRFDEIAIGQCYIIGIYPARFSKTSQATISYPPSRKVQGLHSYQVIPAVRTSTNTSTLLGAPYHHTIRSRVPIETIPYE